MAGSELGTMAAVEQQVHGIKQLISVRLKARSSLEARVRVLLCKCVVACQCLFSFSHVTPKLLGATAQIQCLDTTLMNICCT